MNKAMLTVSILALSAMMTASSPAADDVDLSRSFDPQSALEVLKTLEGQWTGTAITTQIGSDEEGTSSPAGINYRVSANGSTVIATYREGSQMEMLTIYHMNGPDELMLTHYCALRNQPQMRLEPVAEKSLLVFAFSGGTNFDPKKDRHAHEGTLRFIDADTIETTSIAYNMGKPSSLRKATLKRKK